MSINGCDDNSYDLGYQNPAATTLGTSNESEVRFIALGDWGRRGMDIQQEVADQMAIKAENDGCDFVISTGDNFYPNGVNGIDDSHWQETYENVYDAASLNIPWYPVLGNHDYYGDVEAQIEYTEISGRWSFPSRNYAYTYEVNENSEALFVFFDSEPLFADQGTEPELHLTWLHNTLSSSNSEWKIVISHNPVYSGGQHGTSRLMVNEVLPILEHHQVQIYISGHDHDMQHLYAGGEVNFFVSGAGSSVREVEYVEESQFALSKSGFLYVTIEENESAFCFIDYTGNEVYNTIVAR